jgi:hypothetical protein
MSLKWLKNKEKIRRIEMPVQAVPDSGWVTGFQAG